MQHELTPIRLPSGKWIIRRETMADDCATILKTEYLTLQGWWETTVYGHSLRKFDTRPSVELLQHFEQVSNGTWHILPIVPSKGQISGPTSGWRLITTYETPGGNTRSIWEDFTTLEAAQKALEVK